MADLSVTDVSSLGPAADAPATAQTPERLRALAAQFESLLLGQMLKEMRQSMFDDDEDKGNGFGSGPLADTIFSELSQALSRAGGMGLGSALLGPLVSQANLAGGDNASGDAVLPANLDLPVAGAPADVVSAAMPGRLSSGYGWRKDPIDGEMKFHKGLDLAMPVGQDVPAARKGQVAFAGEMDGYGLTVVIKHDNNVSTRYAHLSKILVAPGDTVKAGETIAMSGATGRATGPHLHFEVLENGQSVDPGGAW